MRILITTLFLFSFCFSSNINAEQSPNPWQLRQSHEGIPVYTRKVAGSAILEYKADVIVKAPIPKVIALFEDEKQIPRWYYQCVHSELVEHDGPDKEVIYLVLHLPWPVAARDFVFSRTRTKDLSGVVTYSLKALPDRLPHVKGMIRVNSIESIWRFKSLADGKTDIYFQQHTDPAGSIPASLLNQIGVQAPFYSLRNFRKLITGKDA